MITTVDELVTLDSTETFDVLPSGILTVEGPMGHRTFKIARQASDAMFMPGVRLVSLLVGSDEWRRFGRVSDFAPMITVFQSLDEKSRDWSAYAKMLVSILHKGRRVLTGRDGLPHAYTVMWSRRCFRCSRRLTTPESIRAGIGPDCAAKGGA